MIVILLFTPCAKDKIVFPILSFFFVDFWYKKRILIIRILQQERTKYKQKKNYLYYSLHRGTATSLSS